MRVMIDRFDTLGDLKPKDRANGEMILDILRRVKRFSVWEHDRTLQAISTLRAQGKLWYVSEEEGGLGYPWISVEVPRRLDREEQT